MKNFVDGRRKLICKLEKFVSNIFWHEYFQKNWWTVQQEMMEKTYASIMSENWHTDNSIWQLGRVVIVQATPFLSSPGRVLSNLLDFTIFFSSVANFTCSSLSCHCLNINIILASLFLFFTCIRCSLFLRIESWFINSNVAPFLIFYFRFFTIFWKWLHRLYLNFLSRHFDT